MTKIIAEVGSVHDGSFGNACRLIAAAADCGADVVKFQTHIAEAESLSDAPNPPYFSGEPRLQYFKRTGFSRKQWRGLKSACEESGVQFLSSPFSLEAVDLLEEVGVDMYKIPSGEVTNLPLLETVAQTGKAVFLSSGMSSWPELDRAVETLRGGGELTVMQCTSAYPCPAERVGLNVIPEMRERYGVDVGFSDHTMGFAAAFAAAALGATAVEKHFAFSRLMYGSDALHSMEPEEFRQLCLGIRQIWTMRENSIDKNDLTLFRDMKEIFEKSIVTSQAIAEGTELTAEHLSYKKPGSGIPAARYRELVGQKTRRDLPGDHLIGWDDIQ